MMNKQIKKHFDRLLRSEARFVTLRRITPLFVAVAMAACNSEKLLDVPDPDVATPQSVQDKAALPTVLAGAIGDFQFAFSGNNDNNVITLQGLFTDELIHAETFPTRLEFDLRNVQALNLTGDGLFRNIQRARTSAQRAAEGYAKFDPTNPGYAEALNLESTTFNLIGESYCSGVPFSTLTADGATIYSDAVPRDEIFNRAVARADSAIKVLGAQTSAAALQQLNFAKVEKGRALINLNKPAEAATAVAGVPTSFRYVLIHSQNTARQNNGLWVLVFTQRRFSVSNLEGTNGLPYRSDNDPRVQQAMGTGGLAIGVDGFTPMFLELKYPLRESNAIVADGPEARLIEAEASLRAGDVVGFFLTLNTLRSAVGLGPLIDPGTPAGRENLLFKERAYQLWLTGHRLGDLRRLVRQYARGAQTVFPTGTYHKGGSAYGPDVNFPVSFDELNNPQFTGCLDRAP